MDEIQLLNSIETRRNNAAQNYVSRHFDLYFEFFSENLKYKKVDGKILNKEELINLNATKLLYSKIYDFEYNRISFRFKEDTIEEHLVLNMNFETRSNVIFTKKWNVELELVYAWIQTNEGLKVKQVREIKERIRKRPTEKFFFNF